MKIFVIKFILGVIIMASIFSCSSKTVSPVCSVEFQLEEKKDNEILVFYEELAAELSLKPIGYDRNFPSGERVMVFQAGYNDHPVFGVMNLAEVNGYILSIYPAGVEKKLFEKIYQTMVSSWGSRIVFVRNDCVGKVVN